MFNYNKKVKKDIIKVHNFLKEENIFPFDFKINFNLRENNCFFIPKNKKYIININPLEILWYKYTLAEDRSQFTHIKIFLHELGHLIDYDKDEVDFHVRFTLQNKMEELILENMLTSSLKAKNLIYSELPSEVVANKNAATLWTLIEPNLSSILKQEGFLEQIKNYIVSKWKISWRRKLQGLLRMEEPSL